MLQQTRVPVAAAYFLNFMKLFPSVDTLAAAGQSSVLSAWSGLGYYRRARMLHRAAGRVVKEFTGHLPRHAAELRQLDGIGRYTAAAIASIAFQQPEAAVDGNIERVLSRILPPWATAPSISAGQRTGHTASKSPAHAPAGEGYRKASGERTWRAARELLSVQRPGDFNQAMMELGATVCLPRDPRCDRCPVHGWCAERASSSTRPAGIRTSSLKKRPAKRILNVGYALSTSGSKVLLIRRPSDARQMPAMWELPPSDKPAPRTPPPLMALHHAITNTMYRVSIHSVKPGPLVAPPGKNQSWVHLAKLDTLPLTGLCRKVMSALISREHPGWEGLRGRMGKTMLRDQDEKS